MYGLEPQAPSVNTIGVRRAISNRIDVLVRRPAHVVNDYAVVNLQTRGLGKTRVWYDTDTHDTEVCRNFLTVGSSDRPESSISLKGIELRGKENLYAVIGMFRLKKNRHLRRYDATQYPIRHLDDGYIEAALAADCCHFKPDIAGTFRTREPRARINVV